MEKSKTFTIQTSTTAPDLGTFAGLDSARSLFAAKGELVMVDKDGIVFSWNASLDKWHSCRSSASLVSPAVSLSPAQKDGSTQSATDAAEAGGWRLTVWQPLPLVNGCRLQIQDVATGAIVVAPIPYGTNARNPSALALNGILFAFYVNTSTNELHALRIVPGVAPLSFSDVTISTSTLAGTPWTYDVDANAASTFGVAFYRMATGRVDAVKFNSAGTNLASATAAAASGSDAAEGVCCAVEPNTDRVGFAHIRLSAGNRTLRGGVLNSSLGSILADQVIDSAYSTAAPICAPTCIWESAIVSANYQLHVLYSAGMSGAIHQLKHAIVNDGGTVLVAENWIAHNALASRAFRDGPNLYVVVVGILGSSVQAKYVVVAFGGQHASTQAFWQGKYSGLGDKTPKVVASPVATFADGDAVNDAISPTTPDFILPHASVIGTRRYLVPCTRQGELMVAAVSLGGQGGRDKHAWHAVVDFGASTLRAVEVNGVTYLTGGQLMEYDRAPVEGSFLAFPDPALIGVTQGAGGSLTALGQYSYVVRYAWTNSRGIRTTSTWISITVTLTGANNRVTLTLPTLPFSSRQSQRAVSIEVFRTKANPTANPDYFRVTAEDPASNTGSQRYVANDPSVASVTLVDDRPDANLTLYEVLDQSELDPVSVARCSAAATDGNRLFLAGLDDPNLVWPSLLVEGFGDGVKFHEDLRFRVDDFGGPITALAILNESLIVFKERAIYVVNGEGPDNTGSSSGGRFSTPALIQSDVGCVQSSTLAVIPGGVVFMSAKGFCLLNQSLQVQYIGAAVEKYNNKTFVAATVLPKQRQVRFLSDSSPSLCFDYELEQWSEFTATHFGAAGAVYLDSQYVYAKADGAVRFEDGALSQDGGTEYAMLVETAWLHGASWQQLLQGGRLAVLGRYYTGHKLRLTVFYDYDDSVGTVIDHVPPGDNGVQQVRFDLPGRHHFQSVRFRLEDVTSGAPLSSSFSLVELAVELADEGGIVRLPAARSA